MILSVTINTAIDWTLVIPHFASNETMYVDQNVWGMSGKPSDASWILGELGVSTTAMGFAAGLPGKKMEELLHMKGVQTDFVQVEGETRLNVHVIDRVNRGQSTIVTDTLVVKPAHAVELIKRYTTALGKAKAAIVGGRISRELEKNILVDLVRLARERDIPVALDTSGKYIQAILEAHPTVIKLNCVELSTLAGKQVITIEDAYTAAHEVLDKYGTEVIVTMGGANDSLAVLKEHSYVIPAPEVKEVVSTFGAGDGVLAGLGYALGEGKSMEEGLRLGFAAAGAVIMTLGPANCHKADVDKLLPTIQLIPFK